MKTAETDSLHLYAVDPLEDVELELTLCQQRKSFPFVLFFSHVDPSSGLSIDDHPEEGRNLPSNSGAQRMTCVAQIIHARRVVNFVQPTNTNIQTC